MAEMEQFDGIVIGAGQAGGPLATALADAGWKMAIVEREHAGGTCVNEGCTPTKTMVASARIAHLARRADEYGVSTGPVSVDQRVIRQRSARSSSSGGGGGAPGSPPAPRRCRPAQGQSHQR